MARGGDERSTPAWSGAGCRAGGGGKLFVAGGRAGLTGQQQRRLVPPGFPLKTQPPPHLPPVPEHLTHVSPLSPLPPLSPLLSSLLLLFLPSITLHLLPFFSLTPFLHFFHFRSFFFFFLPSLLVWAITDTQQRDETWGWVAAVVG